MSLSSGPVYPNIGKDRARLLRNGVTIGRSGVDTRSFVSLRMGSVAMWVDPTCQRVWYGTRGNRAVHGNGDHVSTR